MTEELGNIIKNSSLNIPYSFDNIVLDDKENIIMFTHEIIGVVYTVFLNGSNSPMLHRFKKIDHKYYIIL